MTLEKSAYNNKIVGKFVILFEIMLDVFGIYLCVQINKTLYLFH